MPMQWNINSSDVFAGVCPSMHIWSHALLWMHVCVSDASLCIICLISGRTISGLETQNICFSQFPIPPPFLLLFLTHSLRCATDGRVAVSGALLVSLDLLPQSALHTVTAALYQVVSSLLQTCQAILKASYFLHDGLWRTKQPSRSMLERGSRGDRLYIGHRRSTPTDTTHCGRSWFVTGPKEQT